MNYTIKELIEKACALSIEAAELAFAIGSSGGNDSEIEKKKQACKQKYSQALEALRLADTDGFQHNQAKITEITRMAMKHHKGSGADN
jgi:hypothetical protein